MRWLFSQNPDINTVGNCLPAGKSKLCVTRDLPEKNSQIGEEKEMGLMRKQMLMRQKARFEHTLQDRLSFLSGKGIKSPKAEKDTIVRKMMADLKAVNKRLRVIAASEKRTEEMAKIKAERAAAPQKEQEGGKGEKPKRAAGEGKEKKIKTERAAVPQKEQEDGKGEKREEALEAGNGKKIEAERAVVPQKEQEDGKGEKHKEALEEGKGKKIEAERVAAPQKEQEDGKGEKPKKAAGEGKGKKIKAEKKAAPPKAPEGDKSQKTTESPEEGKVITKKKTDDL
jgi:hypothetical protein